MSSMSFVFDSVGEDIAQRRVQCDALMRNPGRRAIRQAAYKSYRWTNYDRNPKKKKNETSQPQNAQQKLFLIVSLLRFCCIVVFI